MTEILLTGSILNLRAVILRPKSPPTDQPLPSKTTAGKSGTHSRPSQLHRYDHGDPGLHTRPILCTSPPDKLFQIGVMVVEASPTRKPAVNNFPAMWPRSDVRAATSLHGTVAKGKAKVSGF